MPSMKVKSKTYYSNYPHPLFYLAILTAITPCGVVEAQTTKAKFLKISLTTIISAYSTKKSPTHLDPSSATYSAIDLTLCDTSLFLDFTWRVYDDTCGSDHFPIVLESLHPQDDDLPWWRLNKANWEEFRSQCQKHLIVNNTETIPEFSKKLINIAKTCIPHNPTIHKRDRPWFSKECKQSIRLRQAALWKFNTEPTTSNLISFKFHRANARKIIKEAKKKSWQNYVSKLNTSSNIKNGLAHDSKNSR